MSPTQSSNPNQPPQNRISGQQLERRKIFSPRDSIRSADLLEHLEGIGATGREAGEDIACGVREPGRPRGGVGSGVRDEERAAGGLRFQRRRGAEGVPVSSGQGRGRGGPGRGGGGDVGSNDGEEADSSGELAEDASHGGHWALMRAGGDGSAAAEGIVRSWKGGGRVPVTAGAPVKGSGKEQGSFQIRISSIKWELQGIQIGLMSRPNYDHNTIV